MRMRPLPQPLLLTALLAGGFALATLVLTVIALNQSARLSEAAERQAELTAENNRLGERNDRLDSALAEFNANQRTVSQGVNDLEGELTRVRSEYADLQETATETRARLEAANEELDALRGLEEENEALRGEMTALRGEVEELEEQLAESRELGQWLNQLESTDQADDGAQSLAR